MILKLSYQDALFRSNKKSVVKTIISQIVLFIALPGIIYIILQAQFE